MFIANRLKIYGGETAIEADLICTAGNWEMTHAKLVRRLRCPGARIDGQLRLSDTRVFGSELAIRANGVDVRGGFFVSRSLMVGLEDFLARDLEISFYCAGLQSKLSMVQRYLLLAQHLIAISSWDRGLKLSVLVFSTRRKSTVCVLEASRLRCATIARFSSTQPQVPQKIAGSEEAYEFD